MAGRQHTRSNSVHDENAGASFLSAHNKPSLIPTMGSRPLSVVNKTNINQGGAPRVRMALGDISNRSAQADQQDQTGVIKKPSQNQQPQQPLSARGPPLSHVPVAPLPPPPPPPPPASFNFSAPVVPALPLPPPVPALALALVPQLAAVHLHVSETNDDCEMDTSQGDGEENQSNSLSTVAVEAVAASSDSMQDDQDQDVSVFPSALTSDPLIPSLCSPSSLPAGFNDHLNAQLCVDYLDDILTHFRQSESRRAPSPHYMQRQTDITPKMREILIDWLVEVHLKFRLQTETLYLTCNLIDRFLERRAVSRNKLQLVGCTAMLIASKYEEIYAPEVLDFVHIADKAYTREQILAMEGIMLTALNFNITVPSSYRFGERFIRVAQISTPVLAPAAALHGAAPAFPNPNGVVRGANGSAEGGAAVFHPSAYLPLPNGVPAELPGVIVKDLSNYLMELTLQDYRFLAYLPSVTAASAVYLALASCGSVEGCAWSPVLVKLTGYAVTDLSACVADMAALANVQQAKYRAVRKKYAQKKWSEVSKITIINPMATQ